MPTAPKLKAIRIIKVKQDTVDLKGLTIRKGLTLHVMKEGPFRPWAKNQRVLVVRVDNGTGMLDLMPETAIVEET